MAIKNKATILFLIAAIATAAIFYFLKTKNSFDYQLKKIGIELAGVEGFKLKDVKENKISAEENGEVIKVEVIENADQAKADEYIKSQTALIDSMFDPQLPPYPEFLTKQTGCDEKYKPQENELHYGKYLTLYAGDRLGYGICTQDLIKYRSSIGLFYCRESNKIFKVEYFINKDDSIDKLTNFNESFSCK